MIACPQCGKLNPENFNYCLECGAELHPETSHSAESQFFIDLSSTSPEVRDVREEAGKGDESVVLADAIVSENPEDRVTGDTPMPNIEAAALASEPPAESQSSEPKILRPGTEMLELSPDDLIDDSDDDIRNPFAMQGASTGGFSKESSGQSEPPREPTRVMTAEFEAVSNLSLDSELEKSLDEGFALGENLDTEPDFDMDPDFEMDVETDLETGSMAEMVLQESSSNTSEKTDMEQSVDLQGLEPDESTVELEDEPMIVDETMTDDAIEGAGGTDRGFAGGLEMDMDQAEERHCIKCGTELKASDHFCSACGTSVEGDLPDEASGQTVFMHIGDETGNDEQLVGKLVMIEPSGKEGRTFNILKGENVCGRTGGSILLDDVFVSPMHCAFTCEDDKITVKDKNSLNGVFTRVKGEVPLPSKSKFRVGQQLLAFYTVDDFEQIPISADNGTKPLGSPLANTWGKLMRISNDGRILEHIPLQKPVLAIGRDKGDVTFPDDGFVSGTHAKISYNDGNCSLMDLGSSNGTFIAVTECELTDKDMVMIGKKLLRFELV